MAWDQEKKDAVIKAYTDGNPTPENSMELVKQIADEFEESANGVRMILTKAEVYVKKEQAAKASGGSSGGAASTRVSKADAQASLTAALQDAGQTADEEIISKLTGKAAVYFAGVITAINEK